MYQCIQQLNSSLLPHTRTLTNTHSLMDSPHSRMNKAIFTLRSNSLISLTKDTVYKIFLSKTLFLCKDILVYKCLFSKNFSLQFKILPISSFIMNFCFVIVEENLFSTFICVIRTILFAHPYYFFFHSFLFISFTWSIDKQNFIHYLWIRLNEFL